MTYAESKVAQSWWDYTTLDEELLEEAARLDTKSVAALSRPGFSVRFFETQEEFFLAEALEYVDVFKGSTSTHPAGLCGPIGPTEQLPLVARIINELEIDVRDAHFWGMDEWVVDGKEVSASHPLSFARSDMELCFNRIEPRLRMPDDHLHFPSVDGIEAYSRLYDQIDCRLMQGGQGETKHWAFNEPPERTGDYVAAPPSPEEYRKQGARLTNLHPMTIIQNARTSSGGIVSAVPTQALTVGPRETWKTDKVSIWHPGWHDNPFGIRLTALMISRRMVDARVPMSLLGEHDNVVFNYLRPNFGSCKTEMH